ncbi:MAG: peptidyl-prolyl cis-trans isomerase [Deltaproteobacteria bacterium]|nr:peptidyl-prolyl cis-trans isomerase [Deltaproteobacteria bacterium]
MFFFQLYKKHCINLIWAALVINTLACTQRSEKSIVARVNKQEILLGDLHTRLKEYQFDSTLNTAEKNLELKKNILNEMIQEHIVSQLALEKQLTADPEEVSKILQMTYTEQELSNSDEQDNIEIIKQRIAQQILATQLYNSVTNDVAPPTEEELQAYYQARPEEFIQEEQIRIQQIIVSSQEEAQKILAELGNHTPFEILVKKYSALPESTLEGDTGFVSRGMFDEELESEIYQREIGTVGPIIQSPRGFHIVKVLDKKQSKSLDFAEVRDFIYQNILQQKKEKHYNKWLEQKILQANIERNHAILQQNTPIS